MSVYWFTWITTLVLALIIQGFDYDIDLQLTTYRRIHSNDATIVYVASAALLILIAGCRYRVGADFSAYYNYQNYLDLVQALKELDEPGIRLVYLIASKIHASGQFCIFSVALVTIGLELKVIYDNTDRIGLAIFLYVLTCWMGCFNAVRQCLAISVFFYGYPYLRDREYLKYFLCVMLAFLCHRSAIVMLLVVFIIHREVNINNTLTMIASSVIILLSYDRLFRVMNVIMDNNVTGNEAYWSTAVNILRPLSKVIIAGLYLYIYSDKKKTDATNFYLNITILSAVIAVITMKSAALSRMSMYTAPLSVMANVELLKGVSDRNVEMVEYAVVFFYWVFAWFECHHALFTFRHLQWFW